MEIFFIMSKQFHDISTGLKFETMTHTAGKVPVHINYCSTL